MAQMLNVDIARERLRQLTPVCRDVERVPVSRSAGRVLARTSTAQVDLPPFDCSAMDGYALSVGSNGNSHFRVTGESRAGVPYHSSVKEGEAVRIFTGAVLPPGADTVVLQEDVLRSDDTISVQSETRAGSNIRHQGTDVAVGDAICTAGTTISPYDISFLTAAGVDSVEVTRKIRLALFSTGDELSDSGTPLPPGGIYDSNRSALIELSKQPYIEISDLGRLPDDADAIRETIQQAITDSDVIVTSGGVSVGDADLVRPVVQEIGRLEFWNIALKPGKPLAVATMDGGCLFFGLPGNPVSSIVTYLLFVAPTIRSMSGATIDQPFKLNATLENPIRHSKGRREYQRGRLTRSDGHMVVQTTGDQSSNRLSTFSGFNCLIEISEDHGDVEVGEQVAVVLVPSAAHQIWTG